MKINSNLIFDKVKIKRVTSTTDSNGFFTTGFSKRGYVVLGGRYANTNGKNGFYIPYSTGAEWTLKCMNWDMTTTGFVNQTFSIDVVYVEIP